MVSSKKVTLSVLSREQSEGVGARVRRSIGRPEVCRLGGCLCFFAEGTGGTLRVNLGREGPDHHELFCGVAWRPNLSSAWWKEGVPVCVSLNQCQHVEGEAKLMTSWDFFLRTMKVLGGYSISL